MPSENGYGTVNGAQRDRGRQQHSSDESEPLLGNGGSSTSGARFREYMTDDIDKRWADLLLLLGYIITGLLDSSATFEWGSFVSMQTGNTIYLGMGIVAPKEATRWIRSGISIAFFCFGSFCFSRFHRYFSPRRRWVLLASYVTQLSMIIAAAIIVRVDSQRIGDLRWQVLVPLMLVAFQSSGAGVTSRALQYNALTSVVLTSIYIDLFSDPLILAGLSQNAERNRRIAAPLLLLGGACLGGVWAHTSFGLAGALLTAAGLKIAVIIACLFWRAEKKGDSQ